MNISLNLDDLFRSNKLLEPITLDIYNHVDRFGDVIRLICKKSSSEDNVIFEEEIDSREQSSEVFSKCLKRMKGKYDNYAEPE